MQNRREFIKTVGLALTASPVFGTLMEQKSKLRINVPSLQKHLQSIENGGICSLYKQNYSKIDGGYDEIFFKGLAEKYGNIYESDSLTILNPKEEYKVVYQHMLHHSDFGFKYIQAVTDHNLRSSHKNKFPLFLHSKQSINNCSHHVKFVSNVIISFENLNPDCEDSNVCEYNKNYAKNNVGCYTTTHDYANLHIVKSRTSIPETIKIKITVVNGDVSSIDEQHKCCSHKREQGHISSLTSSISLPIIY